LKAEKEISGEIARAKPRYLYRRFTELAYGTKEPRLDSSHFGKLHQHGKRAVIYGNKAGIFSQRWHGQEKNRPAQPRYQKVRTADAHQPYLLMQTRAQQ
jgi:hypothetical protein